MIPKYRVFAEAGTKPLFSDGYDADRMFYEIIFINFYDKEVTVRGCCHEDCGTCDDEYSFDDVEEEHRYYVLFGSQLHDDNWTYALTKSGSIELFEKDVLPEWDRIKLTEQEIKDYDPRYWAFAKPVEEDE